MSKRQGHQYPGTWVLYLIPPAAVAMFLVWLMRDVWHWF